MYKKSGAKRRAIKHDFHSCVYLIKTILWEIIPLRDSTGEFDNMVINYYNLHTGPLHSSLYGLVRLIFV